MRPPQNDPYPGPGYPSAVKRSDAAMPANPIEFTRASSSAPHAIVGLLFAAVSYGVPIAMADTRVAVVAAAASVLIVAAFTVGTLVVSFPTFLFYWVSLFLMQNVFAGLWLTSSDAEVGPIVTESKTVAIVVAFLWGAPKVVEYLRYRPWLYGWLIALFIGLVINFRGFHPEALAYGRNFAVPILVCVLTAAMTSDTTEARRVEVARSIVTFAAGILIVGFMLELVLGTETWRDLINVTSIEALSHVSDSTRLFGVQLPRVAGFVIEPTNAGYIAAGIAVLSVVLIRESARFGRSPYPMQLAFVTAMVLLVGAAAKSGFLMFAIAAISLVVLNLRIRTYTAFAISWAITFCLIVGYVVVAKGPSILGKLFTSPSSIVGGDSTTYHLAGLMNGLGSLFTNPIGHGLGNGGNFGKAANGFSDAFWLQSGGESAWGVLAFQLGVLGLFGLLGVVVALGKHWGAPSAAILSGWIAAAMFAEATFGPQTAGLLMIGAALVRRENTITPARSSLAPAAELRV